MSGISSRYRLRLLCVIITYQVFNIYVTMTLLFLSGVDVMLRLIQNEAKYARPTENHSAN